MVLNQNNSACSAILFSTASGPPRFVPLWTSPISPSDPDAGKIIYSPESQRPALDLYHAMQTESSTAKFWDIQRIQAFPGSEQKLPNPYIILSPSATRDGTRMPINESIQDLQFKDLPRQWRGDVLVVKFADHTFQQVDSTGMTDLDMIKRHLATNTPAVNT